MILRSADFYDWYCSSIGYDEAARHLGFRNFDLLCDWRAQQLGYADYADLERDAEDDSEWSDDTD